LMTSLGNGTMLLPLKMGARKLLKLQEAKKSKLLKLFRARSLG